ncbi:MAG: carboxypeptidase-like regulatory domain-containing protein [Armatimonadota bacterium]
MEKTDLDEVNKGAFVINQLPAADYRLTVSAAGYVTRSDIRVNVNGTGRFPAGSIVLQTP